MAENLEVPNSCIRLASTVHRFNPPKMYNRVDFPKAFSLCGRTEATQRLMMKANDDRVQLENALNAQYVSAERVLADSKRYHPSIHSILLSCKFQPDQARLQMPLLFGWISGVEEKPKPFISEAIIYDLVMTVASEGLGHSISATEHSSTGAFTQASRDYAAAAGIFDHLAEDMLPKWISKGSNVDENDLPLECHAPFTKALSCLFKANGQQMAVATLLSKPGTPNYSLLAKLTLGIAEQLEEFMASLRRRAMNQLTRLDPEIFKIIEFSVSVQKALSLYFQARELWSTKMEYGMAICVLNEAMTAFQPRKSMVSTLGIADFAPTSSLRIVKDDLEDFRAHMTKLSKSWQYDNSHVYYKSIPEHIPTQIRLLAGHQMGKATKYELHGGAAPVLLRLPECPDGVLGKVRNMWGDRAPTSTAK